MGYTTGPFKLTDTPRDRRAHCGMASSFDPGSAMRRARGASRWTWASPRPGRSTSCRLGEAPATALHRSGRRRRAERSAIVARESRPIVTGRGSRIAAPTPISWRTDARLHRDGMAPIAGRDAIVRHVCATRGADPMDAGRGSRGDDSADMAVSYGKFREFDRDSGTREGYYAHLWLRDAAGRWRTRLRHRARDAK